MDVAISLFFKRGWEGRRSATVDWGGWVAADGRRIAPTAVKQRPSRRRPWAQVVKQQHRAAVQQSHTSVAEKPHSPPASQGRTPLHAAAIGGHTATAEALMARGADVNAANDAKDVS